MLHVHIRLYLVAQLFLERGLYTAGFKDYDCSKFSGVSYEEALSVAEFWGVSDPRSCALLMHLSEVYCVCEPRTYCTVLLRQAAANCLCMEIQIAHPLVQLPAGRDLIDFYCPLIKPFVNGTSEDSPQRCTLMWTVSTCDIERDIRIMAAMDEHVDFNHWCVLYRKREGQVVRPYEYVPLTFLFGEPPQFSMDVGNEDDPDFEHQEIGPINFLQDIIDNINFLPGPEDDGEGLSSLFSVVGDETPNNISINDFGTVGGIMNAECESNVRTPGSAEQSNATENVRGNELQSEESDEFADAAATLPPFKSVLAPILPSSEQIVDRNFAWNINHGDRHPSASEFYKFVQYSYCAERQFMVRKASTVTKPPKGIPEHSLPPDGIYSQLLECTLAGGPNTKKQSVPEEKRRERKSMKVGCTWAVRGKWVWQIKEYVVQVPDRSKLCHTNGCDPTPQQRAIAITKTTCSKLQRIPLDVLDDIIQMFEEGQAISFIRARIRHRIPLHIKTDARWFMNLRVTLERRKRAGTDNSLPSCPGNVAAPTIHEDATIIPKVLRDIIGPVLRLQGLPVLNLLQKLQREVPGFMFEYVVDRENQLAGWCYMTPRQRASLEDNGDVLFFDTNAKGTNKYGMPFFAPAVMNQDNKHDIVLYGCCVTASGKAIGWVLECMCKMVPAFRGGESTIFSDDACPEAVVAEQLPGSTHLLCAWHIIDLDLYNCGKECK